MQTERTEEEMTERTAIVVPLNAARDAMAFRVDGMTYDADTKTVQFFGQSGEVCAIFDAREYSAIICADIAQEDLEAIASRVFGRGIGSVDK